MNTAPSLALTLLPDRLAVCRLEQDAPLPVWAVGAVTSITRTPDELSVVCPEDTVPGGIRAECGFRCLTVAGPLDFALTGVLASLASPLAAAGVSIFVVSTFDTDLLLVRETLLARALAALRDSGHRVIGLP